MGILSILMKTSLLFVLLFLAPVKVDFFKKVQSFNNTPIASAQVSVSSSATNNVPLFLDHNELISNSQLKTKVVSFYQSDPWFYSILIRQSYLFSQGSRSPPMFS